ncbi:MAG: hypothetical protein ACOYOA_02980, partial [Saprospiraceae bacterium]
SSSDFMPPHLIKAMKEWIEGPKITGEFGFQSEDFILATIADLGLQAVQLSMFSDISTEKIRAEVPLIQEIVIEKHANPKDITEFLKKYSQKADYILLDFAKNNWSFNELIQHQQITLDWLQRICQQYKILLAVDFEAKPLQSFLQSVSPIGLSIRGSEEERPGYKSYDELNAIFDIF